MKAYEVSGRKAPPVLLRVNDLSVKLPGQEDSILTGISFELDRGGLVGIIGPNGSGKTTLLRAISGFLPFGGSVQVDDRSIAQWHRRELARIIAFVRQNHTLSFELDVRELVLLGKTPHKAWLESTTRKDLDHVESALVQVGLAGFGDRSVFSLSGGELQRVFLAQALVQDADLLLLDEPTTHLDVFHQYDLLEQVRKTVANGRAALAVFHDLSQAWRYCDRLVVLNEGRQLAFAPPEEVLSTELIREVFQMDASITTNRGVTGITYLRPAANDRRPNQEHEDLHENR